MRRLREDRGLVGVGCARHIALGTALGGVCLLLCLTAPETRAQDEDACASWPGEVDPLPTTASEDPFAARWAELRSLELARLAQAVEAESPAEAYRLRVHASCLDPGSVAARQGIDAMKPVVLVADRPPPRFVPPAPRVRPSAPRRSETSDVATAQDSRPSADFSALDSRLAETEAVLNQARFRAVLEATESLRGELRSYRGKPGVRERRARIEVMAATALVALNQPEDAADSFDRALDADPQLELDPARTPPKLRRLFEDVRSRRQEVVR